MKKFYFLLLGLFVFSGVHAQIINFPDANFKAILLQANASNQIAQNLSTAYFKIDANNNGEIEVSEAQQVFGLRFGSASVTSLSGLSYFTNLHDFVCTDNPLTNLDIPQTTILFSLVLDNTQLTYLDVTHNPNLTSLSCSNNQLISLNVTQNPALEFLSCDYNQLTNLNVTQNPALKGLMCTNNQLTSLDVTQNPALAYYLYCGDNQLTTLDVTQNPDLVNLYCNNNQLNSLDVTQNTSLVDLSCNDNHLNSLDVTQNSALTTLDCYNNELNSIFLKNSRNESVSIYGNPNLQYICADEFQLVDIQNQIDYSGYTNCQLNTYCSFVPGGAYYTLQGSQKLDANNNGCDLADEVFPNLKFAMSNGTNSGNLISNSSGNYSISVQAGTHTITPVFENPSYFNVSPSTVNVTFPTQASPFTQDFCITANGMHPDLEVTVLPIVGARPGFDATYKIIYKNKGNQTQSGSVNLVFNDAVLDLVTANPVTTSQTVNDLSWDFVNLLPFETREILVTLNVNSPMETPAVNGGDVLNFSTSITSPATDETPNDNTFVYNQTVVNSFDPNDKTCLEGATIAPTKVGDYVHYMIRFENNGTANAQNIVVKDMIDLAKFDINSIVPIKGSHSFTTRITSGNKVEFIFENINLPFDNANNDGYVAFKIKTKPTLVLGNTFSNSASIYFDYNFPIVTNPATTTIAVLATQDFVFSNYFSLYPNPVKDVLNIAVKETIEITSINIYNTLGQLVLVIPNAQKVSSVDVSGLTAGNYFIKINSDKGTSNTKFIKS
jgi:hypothetical protein